MTSILFLTVNSTGPDGAPAASVEIFQTLDTDISRRVPGLCNGYLEPRQLGVTWTEDGPNFGRVWNHE